MVYKRPAQMGWPAPLPESNRLPESTPSKRLKYRHALSVISYWDISCSIHFLTIEIASLSSELFNLIISPQLTRTVSIIGVPVASLTRLHTSRSDKSGSLRSFYILAGSDLKNLCSHYEAYDKREWSTPRSSSRQEAQSSKVTFLCDDNIGAFRPEHSICC
jgi:hypothetical protein